MHRTCFRFNVKETDFISTYMLTYMRSENAVVRMLAGFAIGNYRQSKYDDFNALI